jgi:hypothetical protein
VCVGRVNADKGGNVCVGRVSAEVGVPGNSRGCVGRGSADKVQTTQSRRPGNGRVRRLCIRHSEPQR